MARSKYTLEILSEAVNQTTSVSGVVRFLGLKAAGGTHTHLSKKIADFGIDTSHFNGNAHNKGVASPKKKTASDILVVLPDGSNRPKPEQLRRALIERGVVFSCKCGVSDMWNGKPIQLEVDHIDGNWYNNLIDNLRFICPNCHSQEPTNRSWKNT